MNADNKLLIDNNKLFVFVLLIPFTLFMISGKAIKLYYIYIIVIFFISYYIGSRVNLIDKRGLIKKKNTNIHIDYKILKLNRALFLLSQIYYFKFIIYFIANEGWKDIEHYRFFVLPEYVNPYITYFAFMFALMALSYELLYFIMNKKTIKNAFVLIIFMSFFLTELLTMGNRSPIMITLATLGIVFSRLRKISYWHYIWGITLSLVILSFIMLIRIKLNKASYNCFVNQSIISIDANVLYNALELVYYQFYEIGERSAHVINAVLLDNFKLYYGKFSFFSFYSALPGEQVDPAISLNWNLFFGSSWPVGYPPSIIGGLLLDFHLLGIVLGGIILGALGTNLRLLALNRSDYTWTLYYALFLSIMLLSVYGNMRFGQLIIYSIIISITNLIILKLRKVKFKSCTSGKAGGL